MKCLLANTKAALHCQSVSLIVLCFLLLSSVLSWVRPSWKPWSRTRSVWSRLVSSRCLWSKPQRWSVEDQSETPHMSTNTHTDRHTHKLFLLFIKLSLLHHHLSIFPQFPTLVGEGPSSSRKSDSVSLLLFSISIFNFSLATTSLCLALPNTFTNLEYSLLQSFLKH